MEPPNNSLIRLLPYQRKWIGDPARFKVGMMSRQSGKTFCATLEIVDRVIESAVKGKTEDWVILSRGERQAQEALNEGVKKHLRAYNSVFTSNDYNWSGANATHKAAEVVLPNGSKITALPANPDTARGFSRNVLLDEFAFHHDSQRIWAAVFPVVTRGNKLLRVISTPNGKGNKFFEIINDQTGQWVTHITDIHDAIRQGLKLNAFELRAALGDDEAWAREYELKFIDDASAWLPFDLIRSGISCDAGDPGEYAGGPCYIGNDIARKNDLWVACVVEQVGDIFWLRELSVKKNESFASQDVELDRLIRFYKPARVCMDMTGMGMKPVEDAQNKYGGIIEGINFTNVNKHVMATTAKQIFESRRIRIPDDDDLIQDLYKLKKTVSATGSPRFDAESDSRGHADRTWALFLAFNAATGVSLPIDFTATGNHRYSEFAFSGNNERTSSSGFGSIKGGRNDTSGF